MAVRGLSHRLLLLEAGYPGVQQYWAQCTTKRSVNPILGIEAVGMW